MLEDRRDMVPVFVVCAVVAIAALMLGVYVLRPTSPPGDNQTRSVPSDRSTPAPTEGDPTFRVRGSFATIDGQSADTQTRIWLRGLVTATTGTSSSPTARQFPVTGFTTVTNTAAGRNQAAGSVRYRYLAAWPEGSSMCKTLQTDVTTGGRCWRLLGVSKPAQRGQLEPPPMAPGESRNTEPMSGVVLARGGPADLTATTKAFDTDTVIVVLAESINAAPVTEWTFADACSRTQTVPSASGGRTQGSSVERRAIVGASDAVTCNQLPWI